MDIDDNWTGVDIIERYMIGIPKTPRIPFRIFRIEPPTYRIQFYPHCKFKKGFTVAELSTLGRAQRLAVAYYKEWLNVNNDTKDI